MAGIPSLARALRLRLLQEDIHGRPLRGMTLSGIGSASFADEGCGPPENPKSAEGCDSDISGRYPQMKMKQNRGIGRWNYRTLRRYLDELVKSNAVIAFGHKPGNARNAVYAGKESFVAPGLLWLRRKMRKLTRLERREVFNRTLERFKLHGAAIVIPRQVEAKKEPGKYTITWKF